MHMDDRKPPVKAEMAGQIRFNPDGSLACWCPEEERRVGKFQEGCAAHGLPVAWTVIPRPQEVW